MAARRAARSRARARRARRLRFKAHRGTRSHGGSVFRAHRGFRSRGGSVFRAHAKKAMTIRRARPVKPWRGPKPVPYRAAGRRRGFPARHAAQRYKAAGRHLPASWKKPRKHPARFRAAKFRRT